MKSQDKESWLFLYQDAYFPLCPVDCHVLHFWTKALPPCGPKMFWLEQSKGSDEFGRKRGLCLAPTRPPNGTHLNQNASQISCIHFSEELEVRSRRHFENLPICTKVFLRFDCRDIGKFLRMQTSLRDMNFQYIFFFYELFNVIFFIVCSYFTEVNQ